jgi:hypothetical protein
LNPFGLLAAFGTAGSSIHRRDVTALRHPAWCGFLDRGPKTSFNLELTAHNYVAIRIDAMNPEH